MKNKVGSAGEQLVADYLEQQGFTLLERNYYKRFGEIDIIAKKDSVLAFIEVKARKHTQFPLCQVVTRSKQLKMVMVAKEYISKHNYTTFDCRFDVALVIGEPGNLEYISNAFVE